jgi:hypothetical protein
MAAMQETENPRKAPATSVVMIYTTRRLVGRNGGLIKEVKPISFRIRGASHTDIPNRVWAVRRIGLDVVRRSR